MFDPNKYQAKLTAEAASYQQDVAKTIDALNKSRYLRLVQIGYDQACQDYKVGQYAEKK